MDLMTVAIFDSAGRTRQGAQKLRALCAEGTIDVYALAVISKDAVGGVAVTQGGDHGRVGALLGMVLGSLIGLPAGPVGFAAGAMAGAFIGWFIDLEIAGVDGEIIEAVSVHLLPGQSALVTEIDDESFLTLQSDSDLTSGADDLLRRMEIISERIVWEQ